MEYRRLGKAGLKVSEFSFGAWVTFGKQVGEDDAASIMGYAYDNGVNFFDNAEGYEAGNAEIVMGEALKALKWSRDSYAVSSKVFWGGAKPTQRGLSAKHVTDAAHAALKRLQVDYLDLYFCHRPDIDTPIEETVRAMHNLVTQGKVLYWGTSEWSGAAADRGLCHRPPGAPDAADHGAARIQPVPPRKGRGRVLAALFACSASAPRSGRRSPRAFSPASTMTASPPTAA